MRIKTVMAAMTLSLAGLATSASSLAAEPEFTFKLHHFLPPMSRAQTVFLKPWADKVMKESHGRIKIDVYPAMQLGGKPPELFDQVRKGVVDMAWTVAGYTPGRFPKGSVFELPFMATDATATSMALQAYAEKEMGKELKDVHLLAMHTHAPGSLHSRDKEIKSAADLKGMKVRTPNKVMADAFSLLGADPVFMPVTQMPSALSKGVLDVAVLPFEVTKPMKINQLVKYETEIKGDRGLYANYFIFAMNKRDYNKLPPDLQKVIDDNSGMKLARHIGQIFDEGEKIGRDDAIAQGNKPFDLPKAEVERWKQAMQPVTDKWIQKMDKKGFDGKALYKEANDLIDKYKKEEGKS